jgi:hypothetical protein
MKTQHVAIALTVINLVVLGVIVLHLRPAVHEQGIAPVLRGRSLEIVDDHGRVRSQIIVTAATTMPDGKTYPEGALFRLIDPNGRPAVKIGGSAEGSGISLAGDSERREWNGIQILADGAASTVKLTNKDGRQEIVTPK